MCLQELWQFPEKTNFSLPGYHPLIFKLRSSAQGGGVGIFIKDNLKFKLLPEKSIFVERLFEAIFVEVELPSQSKIIIGSMYRPGTKHPTLSLSDQMSQFLDLLSNLCNNLTSQNQIFYILGDLNIDVLKYNSCNFTRDYVELLFSYGLLQVITKPTRCSLNSATLIDHVITNSQASSL